MEETSSKKDSELKKPTTDDLGKTCFQIDLPPELVELQFCLAGASVKPLIVPADSDGFVNVESLDDGLYDVKVYSANTDPPLMLHSFNFQKSEAGLNVKTVHIPGTSHNIAFNESSKSLSTADVEGQFLDKMGNVYQLKGQTSSSGYYNILLPEGHMENLQAKKDRVTVPKRGKLFVSAEKPAPSSEFFAFKKASKITVEVNPSTFANVVNMDDVRGDAGIVVLGDVSGSMSAGGQMDILKRSFLEITEKCKEKKCNVALAAWNSWINWCQDVWIENSNKNKSIADWVKALRPSGGNDMRYAIEDCMRKFPTASDVYVMCDGDVSPFVLSGGITDGSVLRDVPRPSSSSNESSSSPYANTNWPAFRNRFPNTKFHFVALGRQSSAEQMQLMATASDGIFWEST